MNINYKKKYLKYKNKYLQAKKTLKGGRDKKTTPKNSTNKIGIASYNISFATQLNKTIGSESDFVTKCQKKYGNSGGIICHQNAINSINEAIGTYNIQFIGFQEVANKNSANNLEEQISKQKNWKYQYCEHTDKREPQITATLVSMWNPEIFGKEIKNKKIFNLKEDTEDNRPCTIIITENTIIINAHFGWIEKVEDIKPYQDKISTELDKMLGENNTKILRKINHIIFVGDTNDAEGFINSENPLDLSKSNFSFKLHNGLTQEKIKEKLGTCCWHQKGHKYYNKGNRQPGDYAIIMKISENKKETFESLSLEPEHHIIKTDIFEDSEKKEKTINYKSDHDPIITQVII